MYANAAAMDGSSAKLRYRLVIGHSVAIGPGKADLLAALVATGSISAAARSMGMSYKKAWYLLDTMNRAFREPVISAAKGGRGHGGATLTTMGEHVLSLYRAIESKAALAVADDLITFAALIADEAESQVSGSPPLSAFDIGE